MSCVNIGTLEVYDIWTFLDLKNPVKSFLSILSNRALFSTKDFPIRKT